MWYRIKVARVHEKLMQSRTEYSADRSKLSELLKQLDTSVQTAQAELDATAAAAAAAGTGSKGKGADKESKTNKAKDKNAVLVLPLDEALSAVLAHVQASGLSIQLCGDALVQARTVQLDRCLHAVATVFRSSTRDSAAVSTVLNQVQATLLSQNAVEWQAEPAPLQNRWRQLVEWSYALQAESSRLKTDVAEESNTVVHPDGASKIDQWKARLGELYAFSALKAPAV